jgi:hypothetical protein
MDGIVANAAIVQEAITRVNNNKVTDGRSGIREQNVVMGLGTGGLNARYALANLTKNFPNIPTETRLLITHDAPHRGANIALGLQLCTRMLGNYNYFGTTTRQIFPEYDETIRLYESNIMSDILFYRSTGTQSYVENSFIDNIYQPMVNYNSPYKFVATSLGNECANKLFTGQRTFMEMNTGIAIHLKLKIMFGLVSAKLFSVYYESGIKCKSVPEPSYSSREIAAVKSYFKFKLFKWLQVAKTGYDESFNAPYSLKAYDGVPGSKIDLLTFNDLEAFNELVKVGGFLNSVTPALNAALIYAKIKKTIENIQTVFDIATAWKKFWGISVGIGIDNSNSAGIYDTEFTYLPVGSALDVSPFNANTFTEKYVNGVNQNYPSKSNNFIAQETIQSQALYNNASMRFTARNSQWLFNEMENLNNNLNCSNECSNPYYIKGDDAFCTSATYFIPGLPRGATVTWVATPSGLVTPSTNGNQVTLQRISTSFGLLTLTATINNACGGSSITVFKNDIIVAHKPITGIYYNPNFSTGILSSGQSVCSGTVRLAIDEAPQTTYTWQMIFGSAPFVAFGSYVDVTLAENENVSFLITATNQCGSISRTVNITADDPSCGGGFYRFSASPNPTTGDVQIEATGTDKTTTIKEIQVTDKFGNVKKIIKLSTNPKKHKISIADLPADTYIIRIYDGKTWTSKKVIKS